MKIIVSDVMTVFSEINIPDISGYYQKIDEWKDIFENNPPWKEVKRSGLHSKGMRIMNMLNTAKVLCDCFSDLTFSEQVEITVNDEEYQQYIEKALENNGFWEQMPELISNAFALGGCCLKVYADSGKPAIDYIHADKFVPVGWNGKSKEYSPLCHSIRDFTIIFMNIIIMMEALITGFLNQRIFPASEMKCRCLNSIRQSEIK